MSAREAGGSIEPGREPQDRSTFIEFEPVITGDSGYGTAVARYHGLDCFRFYCPGAHASGFMLCARFAGSHYLSIGSFLGTQVQKRMFRLEVESRTGIGERFSV